MICHLRLSNIFLAVMLGTIMACLMKLYSIQLDPVSEDECGCLECMPKPHEDPWFLQRYKRQIPVLLSLQNSNLGKNTSDWWQTLQDQPKGVNYSEVVEILFSQFPDAQHFQDSGPDRCRTCALVGNSGNLEGSHYGPLIDAHDFVISTYTAVKTSIQADKHKVMVLHPDFMRYVYESWLNEEGKYPSTGFLMLVFSLHVCDQVSVFGFGARDDGRWHHYYDKSYAHLLRSSEGNHRGNIEYNITQKLYEKKWLKFYKGT